MHGQGHDILVVAAVSALFLERPDVDPLDRPVLAGRQQMPAVRGIGDRVDEIRVAAKGPGGLALSQIPEPHGLVERGRGELGAVGPEGQGEDHILVAGEVVDQRAIRDRINPDDPRSCRQAGSDGQSPSIATECQGMHRARESRGSRPRDVPRPGPRARPDHRSPRPATGCRRGTPASSPPAAGRPATTISIGPPRVVFIVFGGSFTSVGNHTSSAGPRRDDLVVVPPVATGDRAICRGGDAPRCAGIDPSADQLPLRPGQRVFLERHPPIFVRIRESAHQLALGRSAGNHDLVTLCPLQDRVDTCRVPSPPERSRSSRFLALWQIVQRRARIGLMSRS